MLKNSLPQEAVVNDSYYNVFLESGDMAKSRTFDG